METDIFTPLLWRCVKKYMQTKRRHTVFQDSEDGIKFQHLSTFHTRVTQPRGGGGDDYRTRPRPTTGNKRRNNRA